MKCAVELEQRRLEPDDPLLGGFFGLAATHSGQRAGLDLEPRRDLDCPVAHHRGDRVDRTTRFGHAFGEPRGGVERPTVLGPAELDASFEHPDAFDRALVGRLRLGEVLRGHDHGHVVRTLREARTVGDHSLERCGVEHHGHGPIEESLGQRARPDLARRATELHERRSAALDALEQRRRGVREPVAGLGGHPRHNREIAGEPHKGVLIFDQTEFEQTHAMV